MARTNKDFNKKRNELTRRIWNILIANGYENTTLNFIIKTLNISKVHFIIIFLQKKSVQMLQ